MKEIWMVGKDHTHSYLPSSMVRQLERQYLKMNHPGYGVQDLLVTEELLYLWASDHLQVEGRKKDLSINHGKCPQLVYQ